MRKPLTPEQKEARKAYEKAWKAANKEHLAKWYRDYRKDNPDFNKRNTKAYRERNPDNVKASTKKYKDANKDKIKQARKEYLPRRRELEAQKKAADPLYKLKCFIHSKTTKVFKSNTYTKNSRTYEILGCSFETFKLHLETQFQPWMNWDNRGMYNGELNYGWDIDHIIPLSSAKDADELMKLCHHTNLQPLCSKINRDIKRNNPSYY